MDIIKGGIIAAGHGERFKRLGIQTPKPMLRVHGKPLLHWTLSRFVEAGIEDLTLIFNETNAAICSDYIGEHFRGLKITRIVKNTASSFESFWEVSSAIGAGPFLITTVDSIYPPGELKTFSTAAARYPAGTLVLGITSFVEDEKPLYVEMDVNQKIVSLGPGKTPWVTNGVYWMPAVPLRSKKHYSALRDYLKDLIESGTSAFGIDMGKSVDIDGPRDIKAAESFLSTSFFSRPEKPTA
ncbi:MAG: sugar phosphate nucleotidyltransferase [Nitrospinaceae bacterium]